MFLCRRLVIRIESEMQLGTLTLEDHETDWVSVGERHAHSEHSDIEVEPSLNIADRDGSGDAPEHNGAGRHGAIRHAELQIIHCRDRGGASSGRLWRDGLQDAR